MPSQSVGILKTPGSNSNSHGNIRSNSNSHGNIRSNSNSHGNISSNSNSHGNIRSNSNSNDTIRSNSNSHGNIRSNSNSHGNIRGNSNSPGNISSNSNSHGNISRNSNSHGNIRSNSNSHGNIRSSSSSMINSVANSSRVGDVIPDHSSNNVNGGKGRLSVRPSVQFSDHIMAASGAGGDSALTSPTGCAGGAAAAGGGGGGGSVVKRFMAGMSGYVCAPFESVRAKILKIIHCRLMLMAICALVAIECACVMSELMVDLHGIKLRFDNEAEEINKFVTYFRNKHPSAFESVEVRRMKDFMHLLKTSSTPTSLDAALLEICQQDPTLGVDESKEGESNIMATVKVTPPVYETDRPAHNRLDIQSSSFSLSTDKILNNYGLIENHRTEHIQPNSPAGHKLSLLEMKDEGEKDNQQQLDTEIIYNMSKTEVFDKSHKIASTTSTTIATDIQNTHDTITPSPANDDTSIDLKTASSRSNATKDFKKNINNEALTSNTATTTIHFSSRKKEQVIRQGMTTLSTKMLATTRDRIINDMSSPYIIYKTKSEPPQSDLKLSTQSPPKGQTNDTFTTYTAIINQHALHPEIESRISQNHRATHRKNRTTLYNDSNSLNSTNNTDDRSHQLQQNTVDKEKRTFITNSAYLNNGKNNRTNVYNSGHVHSIDNLFVLAVNNANESFTLIAELLPDHVRSNGSLHSRYMNEYRDVYKTSKALHYTSLTILGVMVIETVVKLFCTGCGFFKNKLEVFDAIIVVLSFCLDVIFLDSRWYETGKDATALLLLLLPWRVVRIVNSFVMTIKHKHQLKLMTLKRGKKKAELKTAKVQSLLKEIRKDVQLLVNLCRSASVDENTINSCLYGKGRNDGVTQTVMEACASLVLISTLGKNVKPQEDDIYGALFQEALDPEGITPKSPEKQQEEDAAIDAAIALDDKIEAKRKSSRRKHTLSVRIQKALLKRSHTMPRRCASLEIPDAESGLEADCDGENVLYIHEETGNVVPEGDYVIVDGDGRYYIRDIILTDEDGGSYDGTHRQRNCTSSEL